MSDPAAPVTPVTPTPAPAAATPPATPAVVPAVDPAAPAVPATPAAPAGDKTPPAKPDAPAADPAKPADQAAPKDPAAPVDPAAPKADAPADPNFKIPEEYKDKPWASKVKSLDDLYKQIDTLDQLRGRKSIVPDLAKATPEDREAFYAQLRPKDASEYIFEEPKTVPLPPEVKTAVGEMLMKNGISATQGNEIIKQYQALGDAEMAKMFDPTGFDTAMKTAFGDKYMDYVGLSRNTLKGLVSEEDNKMLDNLPNSYAALVYRTLGNTAKAVQGLMAKYGVKETNLAHFADKTAGVAPVDVESTRTSLRAQMSSMSGRPHEAAEMQALRDQLAATYKNDPRLQQAG